MPGSDRRGRAGATARRLRAQWDVVLVIAAGGVIGSLARWGVSVVLPHGRSDLPWATVLVNVGGCLAIGALMVVVLEALPPSRYLRPFAGTGVLGGFTTFSTYTLDTRGLLAADRPLLAALYLVGSVLVGLAAVWLGALLARLTLDARGRIGRSVRPRSPT